MLPSPELTAVMMPTGLSNISCCWHRATSSRARRQAANHGRGLSLCLRNQARASAASPMPAAASAVCRRPLLRARSKSVGGLDRMQVAMCCGFAGGSVVKGAAVEATGRLTASTTSWGGCLNSREDSTRKATSGTVKPVSFSLNSTLAPGKFTKGLRRVGVACCSAAEVEQWQHRQRQACSRDELIKGQAALETRALDKRRGLGENDGFRGDAPRAPGLPALVACHGSRARQACASPFRAGQKQLQGSS